MDPALKKNAKKAGLNVSMICRNAVTDALYKLENKEPKAAGVTSAKTSPGNQTSPDVMRGADLD